MPVKNFRFRKTICWRRERTSVTPGQVFGGKNDGLIQYYLATRGEIWGPSFDTQKEALNYLKKVFPKLKVTK